MPAAAAGILNTRTLGNSHRRLAEILRPGMAVLDAGCGTGAITRGICDVTGSDGLTVGLDSNATLLAQARTQNQNCTSLRFVLGDVYGLPFTRCFDVATSARVLQWVTDRGRVLRELVGTVKPGGCVLILDYDHTRIEWSPAPPRSMQVFYAAFLSWRAAAGMDNSIAAHLPQLFEEVGFSNTTVTPQHEHTERGDADFDTRMLIWADVAATRGHQLVAAGAISERQRVAAERDYREWVRRDAKCQTLYLMAVEATVTS